MCLYRCVRCVHYHELSERPSAQARQGVLRGSKHLTTLLSGRDTSAGAHSGFGIPLTRFCTYCTVDTIDGTSSRPPRHSDSPQRGYDQGIWNMRAIFGDPVCGIPCDLVRYGAVTCDLNSYIPTMVWLRRPEAITDLLSACLVPKRHLPLPDTYKQARPPGHRAKAGVVSVDNC